MVPSSVKEVTPPVTVPITLADSIEGEDPRALCTDAKDIVSKQMFSDYTIHAEFFLPFRPEGRSQGRANSGFYQAGRYEVQVLDSFGLEGLDNECGGIYKKATPDLNMCYPPLTWQTYDVEFSRPPRDDEGRPTENIRVTVRHNGVVIHDAFDTRHKESVARGLNLQRHNNRVQYRNIWLVQKEDE